MNAPTSRALTPSPPGRAGIALEAARLRAEAELRYGEADLLVAALRDHIRDLRHERDLLLSEVARLRDDARRTRSPWLERGMKGNRERVVRSR